MAKWDLWFKVHFYDFLDPQFPSPLVHPTHSHERNSSGDVRTMLIQFRKCLKQSISNSKQREDKEQIHFIPLQKQCHLAGGIDARSGLAWLAYIWHNHGVIEYPSINMTERKPGLRTRCYTTCRFREWSYTLYVFTFIFPASNKPPINIFSYTFQENKSNSRWNKVYWGEEHLWWWIRDLCRQVPVTPDLAKWPWVISCLPYCSRIWARRSQSISRDSPQLLLIGEIKVTPILSCCAHHFLTTRPELQAQVTSRTLWQVQQAPHPHGKLDGGEDDQMSGLKVLDSNKKQSLTVHKSYWTLTHLFVMPDLELKSLISWLVKENYKLEPSC